MNKHAGDTRAIGIFSNKWLNTVLLANHAEQTIAVGWSGGADSTALLLTMQHSNYRIHAWHIDHAWRASSRQEAATLAQQAAAWNIPFYSARLPQPSGRNCEAEARSGRYKQFLTWSREQSISTLCLAHHADDQAETVYMRLLQGSAAHGCQGMRPSRTLEQLTLLRPLLHCPADAMKAVLKSMNISWLEDPSNRDLTLQRNRIRHRSFPTMQHAGYDPRTLFLRWQRQAARIHSHLEKQTDQLLDELYHNSTLQLPWQQWLASSPPVRARALQRMVAQLLGEGRTPGRRHIQLVEKWSMQHQRGGIDLSGCRISRKKKWLILEKR